jgi:pimeloyl-ACP methyl ester carboxylesterase
LTRPSTACTKLWSLSENDKQLSHNFLTLENGLQVHYLANETTPANINTLIIYLHGFPDTCWLWEQQLRSSLSLKAQLVALDLPGCGGSDNHSFYGPDEMLNAVAEAIVQLKRRYLKDTSASKSTQRSVLVSHDW